MVRAEIPFIRIRTRLPIPAKKNLAASLTVEQFENSCPAGTRKRGTVMKPPHWTHFGPALHGIAMRIGTHPQTLQVPEEQMRTDRQDGAAFGRSAGAKSRQQALCRIGSLPFS